MDATLYPKYLKWLQLLNQRDTGLVMVTLLVVIALAWLLIGRVSEHRMQAIRIGLLASFYLTGAILLIVGLVKP